MRFLTVALALVGIASVCSAYYHFVRYNTRTAPFIAVPQKFDLSALPNHTVQYFISDQGPTGLAANDSFAAVASQIRLAARVWNDVETSDLRLRFGGLVSGNGAQLSPGIDVVFSDDVPPGLIAYTVPTSAAEATFSSSGAQFVPITRSILTLRRDLSARPSYNEAFFLTLVHEFGHCVGLQHTLTSSAMSTERTRATTKARPLAADDIAGLSLLYPANGYLATRGAVSGRVTLPSGAGVALASVVALSPNGPAVSALTNPDGTYRIEGVPPGQYYVYAHALPPPVFGEVTPANIVLPLDADRRDIQPGPTFETQYFPGVRDWRQAIPLAAIAGITTDNVNFNVQIRGPLQVYAVQTYSFPGQLAVRPAHLSRDAIRSYLVAAGVGLTAGNQPAQGLSVSLVNGSETVPGVRSYAGDPNSFIQVDVQVTNFAAEGPRHLQFSLNNDTYVLPSGLQMVLRQPPTIGSVSGGFDSSGNRIATIAGTNLSENSRILFDGQPGTIRSMDDQGRLVVAPPAGTGRAAVVALNSDGQSSLFLQSSVPVFEYDSVELGTISLSPAALPAGVEALVEITGVSTSFADGQTTVGFGSSDIVVQRVVVLGPGRMLASVSVAPNAQPGYTNVTVVNGLRLLSVPVGFQVQAPGQRGLSMVVAGVNGAAQSGISAGSTVTVTVANFSMATGVTLTLNDRPVTMSIAGSQITFQVPRDIAPGPAVLRLQVGTESAPPILLQIDPPAPAILSMFLLPNLTVDSSRSVRAGEVLNLIVSNASDSPGIVPANRIQVMMGDVEHQPIQPAIPAPLNPGSHIVSIIVSPGVPVGAQNVMVTVDGRASAPATVMVRN
jgi:hypothetical protein